MNFEKRLERREARLDPPKTRVGVWWCNPGDHVGVPGAVRVNITAPDWSDTSPIKPPRLAFDSGAS